MNGITVYLYDKKAEYAHLAGRVLGKEVHTWHPRNPNREEPTVTVYPESGGIVLTHGGSFKSFASMMKAFLRMEENKIEYITSYHYRGDEKVGELLTIVGQERIVQ